MSKRPKIVSVNMDGVIDELLLTARLDTSCTNCFNCSMVPLATDRNLTSRFSAKLENFGNKRSPTSSLTRTTPFLVRHCIERCKLRDVVPKSITMSTVPPQASIVRSINCFSYKSSLHCTTFTLLMCGKQKKEISIDEFHSI